jgi:hypothetical protein
MTMVRFDMFNRLREAAPDTEMHMTYGAATKLARKELGIRKTHSNDAYAMGRLHPKRRADFEHYKKVRRNNRVLSLFYDAKIIDVRTGKAVKGAELGCNRTKRREPRNNSENLRIYRGEKVKKGASHIRKEKHPIGSGDIVEFKGRRYCCHGCINNGASVLLLTAKESADAKALAPSIANVHLARKISGWRKVQ